MAREEPLNVVVESPVATEYEINSDSITNHGVQNENEKGFLPRITNISGEERSGLSGRERVEQLRKQREETLEDS
jgi:hypothetical protein